MVWASIPKTDPQTTDWKAFTPRPPMEVTPSMLRSGMATKPEVQSVVEEPLAAALVVTVPRIPNGSGEVVEDCFHWIEQYPFSVLIQLV